jgi:hypothetical protein
MSERSEYVKVWDNKNKLERTVTKVAYKILAGRRYDLVEGDVEAPVQKKRNDAPPVAVSTGDLETQLDAPLETTEAEIAANSTGIKVMRKKLGPKPKTNA